VQILPSYRAAVKRGRTGLELAPFRGVRYAQDRVSGLAEVSSPPYDVIFRDKEDQLMAADPHNVVRLILPKSVPGQPGEEYQHAAQSLRQWQEQGILVTDAEPALYVYEQAVVGDLAAAGAGSQPSRADNGVNADGDYGGMIQRGLIGALRLAPPDAGIVLPHEDVAPGPVAGRLQLMEATQANFEPIFLLYDGGQEGRPSAATRLTDQAAATEPLAEAVTSDGVRHRLWALTDPGELAEVAGDLAPRRALIADGHHRYAAYLRLQRRRHRAGAGPGPWDHGLALLVDSAAYPPRIGAIHRVVPGLDIKDAAKLAAAAFAVRPLPAGAAGLDRAAAELAAAGATRPAFVLADAEHAYLVSDPDPQALEAAMPAGRSERWRALPAAVLQELLITRLWGLTDDDRSVRVVHYDAHAAVGVAQETCGTAILCLPMSPADVYEVAARGEKVPRKSTSFAPKPRTGLVMRAFAES
jgi:uncharacterized protein (DUF1015 family)